MTTVLECMMLVMHLYTRQTSSSVSRSGFRSLLLVLQCCPYGVFYKVLYKISQMVFYKVCIGYRRVLCIL